jgi:hypothetical protein
MDNLKQPKVKPDCSVCGDFGSPCTACGCTGEKEVHLRDGDGLKILPESKGFGFKCCDCGLVHQIDITRDDGNIILTFSRV